MSSIQTITESFKGLSVEDLLTIIAAASAEAKKAAKTVSKAPKGGKEKKGSMPKGVVPPQLRKPRAWVDFTLRHANANGWESFKVKGQDEEMPASVEKDGKHVFESTGKPMNNKQAMSLSKIRWDRKENDGTRKDLYDEFDAGYVDEIEVAPKQSVEAVSEAAVEVEIDLAPPKVKKSAVDKNREKKAEKEAAALKKTNEKEAAALKKNKEKVEKAEAPKPKKAKKAKAEAAEEEVPPFDFENDGYAHPWDYKGKKFIRDFDGNLWFRTEEGESAGWAGKFDPATKTIDASAEEPDNDDEE
jgi:hypothetical protein